MATLTPGVGLEGVAPGLDCIYGAVCEFGISARGVGGQPEQVQICVSTLGGHEDRSVFWGVQQDYVRSALLLLITVTVQRCLMARMFRATVLQHATDLQVVCLLTAPFAWLLTDSI